MLTPQEQFDELSFYTLAHGDPQFIHQNAVDAFAAQLADETTKPIKIIFALVGLYLTLEHGYTGKQVQRTHMQLAARRKQWPRAELPTTRGNITVADVLQAPPGEARDQAIRAWCASVWEPYRPTRELIRQLLISELDLDL
jgi:hypothetical protein